MMRHLGFLVVSIACVGAVGTAAEGVKSAIPTTLPSWAVPTDMTEAFESVFGDKSVTDWDMSPWTDARRSAFKVANDPLLGGPALQANGPLTLRRAARLDDVTIRCRVRFTQEAMSRGSTFILLVGGDPADALQKPVAITLRTSAKNRSLVVSIPSKSASYQPRAYRTVMPTWPEAMRRSIEADMASIADVTDRWFELRCDRAGSAARVWIDDRHVGTLAGLLPGGIALQAAVGVTVAGPVIEMMPPTKLPADFLPVALDGYARDRAFLDGVAIADESLPFGHIREIDGVPFRFVARSPSGPDHIDLGRSLFRYANYQGCENNRGPQLGGAFTVDPARIQLAVPMDAYDELHAIAGFDAAAGSVPTMTASFYRPAAGFHQVFETTVPAAAVMNATGQAVPIALEHGGTASLWHVRIPLEPGRLSSFADLATVEIELAKRMEQYRTYPDPILYGWRPAGLPSGVHVYALTLHRAPISMRIEAATFGHVWTAPEMPAYEIVLGNRTSTARTVTLATKAASHDGTDVWENEQPVAIPAGGEARVRIRTVVRKHGWYKATFTLRDGDRVWTEHRGFARLAPDTRAPIWREGQGPFFGYWSYHGGHFTPPPASIMRVMRQAGARGLVHVPHDEECRQLFTEWGWREGASARAVGSPMRDWGEREPSAPEITAFRERVVENIRKYQGNDPEVITLFAEPHISRNLTAGSPPDYWGELPYKLDAAELRMLTAFMRTARVAAETVRQTWPKAKLLIPWGDPLFVVPLLRAGFPRHLIDGSGLDLTGFERLPEQQIHQMSTHRLHFLREEYRKFGMEDPALWYMEGVFVPTEPGACTWEEQAERYHRWTLLSLAYGVQRFYSGWFAFDCGDYYGAEHYGGCGIQRRIPYCDPKPAYAHYATMTRLLDGAVFDRWIPTGSHSVYCLRFARPQGGPVHVLWTLRGRRPVTLATTAGFATIIDSMDNATTVKAIGGSVSVTVGSAPVYVTGLDGVPAITLGAPDHSDAVAESRRRNAETWHSGPVTSTTASVHERRLALLGDGSWRFDPARDEIFERNNYDTSRYHAALTARVVADEGRDGPALAVHMDPPTPERKYMPWYARLVPEKPLVIPGSADALGLFVKAASDWGRIVYCLRDAKGERWLSVGSKDAWTCDDPHSWSSFCFDGWRYLRFELPGHAPFDTFRKHGTTWWGSVGGDQVVDLPLTIEAIIVERRTHVMYVNDVQPAELADVLLGELVAEYASEEAASETAVVQSRLRMPLPKAVAIANPIADMAAIADAPPPVRLDKVTQPDWGYDGTRAHVHFTEASVATGYEVWLAADPDGHGAVQLGKMLKSGGLVRGLRPGMKLYLWVTYTQAIPSESGKRPGSRRSRPSNVLEIQLVDEFGMK